MLNGILSQSKEVGTRNRIGVLSVPDGIGLLHNVGPRASRGSRDDGTVGYIRGHDLEFGPVTAIEDGAVVDDFDISIDCRQVTPVNGQICQ